MASTHPGSLFRATCTCARGRQVRGGDAKLDQAFLLFFQQLRKAYVGETAQRSTKVRPSVKDTCSQGNQRVLRES